MPTVAQSVSPLLGLLAQQPQTPTGSFNPLGLLMQTSSQQQPIIQAQQPKVNAIKGIGGGNDPFYYTMQDVYSNLLNNFGGVFAPFIQSTLAQDPNWQKQIYFDRNAPIPSFITDQNRVNLMKAYQAYDEAHKK